MVLGTQISTGLHPRKFGTFLLAVVAIIIIIIKIMRNYNIGKGTFLYTQFNGLLFSLPLLFAIALTLISHKIVMGYKSMIIVFIMFLILSYLIIVPLFTGSI